MKKFLGAVSAIALCVTPALAGEGTLSNQSLAKMGLAGMKSLSDNDGMQLRGLATQAGGWSSTTLIAVGGETSSTNFSYAADKKSATTANLSVSGAVSVSNNNVWLNVIAAGGTSAGRSH